MHARPTSEHIPAQHTQTAELMAPRTYAVDSVVTHCHVCVRLTRAFSPIPQDLYRQIVSQTSEVRACIRTAEGNAAKPPPQQQQQRNNSGGGGGGGAVVVVEVVSAPATTAAGQQPTTSAVTGQAADTVSPPRKSDTSSLKGLETRYHMLYLQAIEVQCLLEGLLARKEKEEADEDSVSCSLHLGQHPQIDSPHSADIRS